jgi:RNA polymerase sigma factor (sigma-70 family)
MTEAAAPDPSGGRVAGAPLRRPARLLSDQRLSRRATTGDRRAFEEIFRRYHQDLYRFCLATVSNPQDAQEALQNTMVKVMRALPGERREIKLKPWLFRIARNEAVETMRKRRDTVELGADRLADPWEIADAASARERLRDLFADLAELPERQRSVLVMRELAGLDFEEIGETFETSPAVARQTLYEARQSLRQMDEGREMSCTVVREAISDADGRVTRRRDIRAHLRDCTGCRAFRDDIARRREGFAAIAPLPVALSAGLLQGLLGGEAGGAALAAGAGGGAAAGAGGAAGGGIGGAAGAGAGIGPAVAVSGLAKSAATVAVVAAVGVGAAERGGLVDLPSPGGNDRAATQPAPAAGAGGEPASPASNGVGEAPGGGRSAAGAGASKGAAAPQTAPNHGGGGIAPGRPQPAAKGRAGTHPSGKPPHPQHPSHAGRPANPGRDAGSPPGGPPASARPQGPPMGRTPPPSTGAPGATPPPKSATPPARTPPTAPPAAEGEAPLPPAAEATPPSAPPSSAKGTGAGKPSVPGARSGKEAPELESGL